jgi:3-hydroxyacyl-CoA dehydrogenase
MSFADYGYPVKITDPTKEAPTACRDPGELRNQCQARQPDADRWESFARIEPVPIGDAIADCDVVIEACRQIPAEQEVWKKIDARSRALLFSNTSGIDIDVMARETKRPQTSPARISSRPPMS